MSTSDVAGTLAGAIVLASPHPTPDLFWTPLVGRPLLAWSVAACAQIPAIAEIALLIPAQRVADAAALAMAEGWAHVRMLAGGVGVRETIEAGLGAIDPALAWVVIHEASRPLVLSGLIGALLDLARQDDADYCVGGPVKETVKRVRDELVVETLPRERLARVQSPCVFNRARLVAALAVLPPERDFSDPASLALAAGLPLRVFPASADDIRVRTPEDIAVAETLLAGRAASP